MLQLVQHCLTRHNAIDVSLGIFGALESGSWDLDRQQRKGALDEHSELMSQLGCRGTHTHTRSAVLSKECHLRQ